MFAGVISPTIGDVLSAHAMRDPEAPAIVCPGVTTLGFGDLARRVHEIGRQFREAGIGSASRVGIALQRGPESALLSVAVSANATLLPINPNLAAAELREELARVRLDALIVPDGAGFPDWLDAAGQDVALFKAGRAKSSFDEIVLEQGRGIGTPRPPGEVTARSWAAIFRTSGTTGPSKRVPVTHGNLIEMARKMERWLALTPADRSACIMPLYYNAGFKATLVVPLLIGCSVALPDSAGTHDVEQWLGALRPTWLTASPAFLRAVVEKLHSSPNAGVAESLRFVLSTASYLPEQTRQELQRLLGKPVVEFYGLCEAGMMTGPVLAEDGAGTGSVGRVPAGELAIFGERGERLRAGQVGQVMLRGPSVMPGYLVGDIDGQPTGLVDGWLATGDLGSIDGSGLLTIAGRTKEIINRGGEKISPYDVERAFLAHPSVREAAAFAVPHPRLGENVGAAVVLQPGTVATSTDLIDFVYDRLAPFQRPRYVHIVDSLPVGPTGKISRPALSAAFADARKVSPAPAAPLEILIGEIWQRRLGHADIGVDDDFFEIGGDSLQAAEMLLEIEKITRHRIAPSDIRAQLSIRLLCERLADAVEAREEVMTRVRAGQGTPLFLCHGDFCGWGFYGFRLTELLKGNDPVYLLHSVLDDSRGIETIEDMTARYMADVQAAAPTGAIRLAGFCHGGLAALDLARRLEAAGRTVEKVVLIDTYSLNARPPMRLLAPVVALAGRMLPGGLGRKVRRSGMTSLWVLVSHMLRRDPTILRRVRKVAASGSMRAWDASRRTTYFRAMANFLPARIHADVICLLCDEYAGRREYEAAPWARVAPRVQSGRLPGRHNTCVSTHVDVLAQRLNKAFTPLAG